MSASLANQPPRLHSLGQAPAPVNLVQQWRALSAWPAPAVQDLWAFLHPLAADPRAKAATEALRGFSQQHGMGRGEVGAAGTALHNLLLRAASLGLPAEAFAQDLDRLGGGPAAPVLLARYDDAVTAIRMRLLDAALAEHGKLLTDLSWRVDTIGDSDAARNLASSVLVLTLGWREGDAAGRTTLQLTPDKVRELRRVLQRFDA